GGLGPPLRTVRPGPPPNASGPSGRASGVGDRGAAAGAGGPVGRTRRRDLPRPVKEHRRMNLTLAAAAADGPGPFETARQVRELPAVRAVYEAFGAGPGVDHMHPHNERMLRE